MNMSAALTPSTEFQTALYVETDPPALQSEYEKEGLPTQDSPVKQWEGRKWAFLGPHANIPSFMHRAAALASASFEASSYLLKQLGEAGSTLDTLGGFCYRSVIQLEFLRDTLDYTEFVNIGYRAIKEGPLFFLEKNGDSSINLWNTASAITYTAIAVLFPVHFFMSRMAIAGIEMSNNKALLQGFANNAPPSNRLIQAMGQMWGAAAAFSLMATLQEVGKDIATAIKETRQERPESSFKDLAQAGWNRGLSWSNINKLQLSIVDFGFALTNGGIVTHSRALSLAFKALAAFNGVTQLCLPEKVA